MSRLIDRADAWLLDHDVAGPLVIAAWHIACSVGGVAFWLWIAYRIGAFRC